MSIHEEQLRIRLRKDYDQPGILEIQDTVVKAGPQAWKTAALLVFGDKETSTIKHRTFKVQTWVRSPSGDFTRKADYVWSCDDHEIAVVRALLTEHLPHQGTYTLVDEGSTAALVAQLSAGDAEATAGVVAELLALAPVRDALASSGAAAAGAALLAAQRQRLALKRLSAVVLDTSTREAELQKALDGEWWLFGGRFIGQHQRRQITVLDQLDIPLLRADGSLHVVELKRAKIPKLVMKHRNHLIVGQEVHLAVAQAMNYLRELDEHSALIRQDLNIDVRRATATVVIGHPVHTEFSEEQVAQTLRTYNSHLARVEVITYAELLAGAAAALDLASPELQEIEASYPDDWDASPVRGDLAGPDPAGDPWDDSDDPWASTTPPGTSQVLEQWDDEPPF